MALRGAEASTMSKSMSCSMDVQARNDIINGKGGPLDQLFPLFDEIQKQVDLPLPLYYIVLLFVIFQVIAVSFWSMLPSNLDKSDDDIGYKIVQVWTQVAFYTDHTDSTLDLTIIFAIVSAFAFIFVFGVWIQIIIFRAERRFIKWTLVLTRIVIEFCPTVCMIPIGSALGRFFSIITSDAQTLVIVYSVISLVYLGIYLFDQTIQSCIFNFNVYLSRSVFVSWDPHLHFTYLVGSSLFALFPYVTLIFATWTQIIVVAGKVAFDIFMVYKFMFLPLIMISLNEVSAALFSTLAILDIIQIVRCIGVDIPQIVSIIVLVVCLIVFYIAFHFFLKWRVKRACFDLSETALEDFRDDNDDLAAEPVIPGGGQMLNDPVKRGLYDCYGIDRSLNKAYFYLRVGIANQCPLFLDWSLIKYIAEMHQDTNMYCTICQMISFFPSESRALNSFFAQTITKPSLKYYQRFLMYQVHRVKGLRQSSASSEITEKLLEMKNLSMDGIQTARNFWQNLPDNISYLYDIRKLTIGLTGMFNEAIEKWPNNIRMCEEFSTFLIEGASDFVLGLKIKHRADLVEQGKNFVIDLPFRSLVRHYPNYLKKAILDVKGNFIVRKDNVNGKGNASVNSQSMGSQSSASSFSQGNNELEAEVEEQLGRSSFSYPRLRLAFQRSLVGRKSDSNERLRLVSYWTILLTIAVVIFLYVWYYSLFDPRAENMERQILLNKFRFGFDSSVTVLSIKWLRNIQPKSLIPDDLWEYMQKPSPKTNDNNLDLKNKSIDEEANRWVAFARDNLELFSTEVVRLAIDGIDVTSIYEEMISRHITYTFCNYGNVVSKATVQSELKSVSTYFFLKLRTLTMSEYNSTTNWVNNEDVCEIWTNSPNALDSFNLLAATISEDQENTTNETTKQNYLILGIMISLYLLLTEPFLFYYLYQTFAELKRLIRIMKNVNENVRKEASQPLRFDGTSTESFHQDKSGNSINPCIFYSMLIVPVVCGCGICIGVVLFAEGHNQAFYEYNQWLFYGIMRSSYIYEAVVYTMLAIVISQGEILPGYLTSDECVTIAKECISTLQTYNNALLRGYGSLKPCIGVNTRLDTIHLSEDCHNSADMGSFHDTYKCASLDRSVNMFCTFCSDILVSPSSHELAYDGLFQHAFHIANDHMIDLTYEAADILADLATIRIGSVQTELSGICFSGLAILLLGFLIFFFLIDKLQIAFDGALQMMLRLPPLSITSQPELFNFLMHKENERSSNKMSAANSVVHLSNDSIFFLNRQESIEVVNKAVPLMLGYTPEQLLGQPFTTVIPQEEGAKIYETFNLMRNGQSSLIVEQDCNALTDSDVPMPVHVTILGITDGPSSSSVAKSFVVILRDESLLIEQRKKAEQAKEQSERLLYQILPRDIVTRLNRGETDISIVVPSATVIFIDIQKFSDYAANLAPSQIMENLSLVFATFDNICAKYPLITKIKLIGDVYMAAGGLFCGPDDPPTAHAQQVVQFALDVLQGLEEVNTQLNASLAVRIGVNTDGPLIAGVLGTDKPVFDIIGDTINVASRLQSNGIPGTVQISQGTYDCIKECGFHIEQRGLLELKGKGKKMAYIVRGIEKGSFFAKSSNDDAGKA